MPSVTVTFDLDHTLVKSRPGVRTLKIEAIRYAIIDVLGLGDSDLPHLGTTTYGMSDRAILRRLLQIYGLVGTDLEEKLNRIVDLVQDYFHAHRRTRGRDDYEVLPGARELLEQLRLHGAALGLATGNFRDFALWKLECVGLRDYFAFGAYGEDGEDRRQIVAAAIARSNSGSNSRFCHFGDSVSDIEAAAANGILAAAVTDKAGGAFPEEMLRNAGANLIINSYYDYPAILHFLGLA